MYAVLASLVSCLSLCTRRGPLSYRRTAWLTFFVDFVRPRPYLYTLANPFQMRPSMCLQFECSGELTGWSLQALSNAVMSAGSAALAVSWIGKHGVATASWNAVCPLVGKFCDYIQGALIACLCAWVFLALSTIVAVSALHHLASHRI